MLTPPLNGRRKILTNADVITSANIVQELNRVLPIHFLNRDEEEYLYWYRRGVQPILERRKSVRPEILNKVVENHCEEIVAFKNGYFLTQPAYYISRIDGDKANARVQKLNGYLRNSGKAEADNKVADWFHTVGVGILYVEPNDSDAVPFKVYALDPRNSFVVYSSRPGNKPVYGVNMVQTSDDHIVFDVFTEDYVYRLDGGIKQDQHLEMPLSAMAIKLSDEPPMPNVIGRVPMVEYHCNLENMGSFESVISLQNALNMVMSNRIDGIEQFIQSLAIAVNCDFEEGTTANDIREAGMIVLKSIGENKADFKILSEQLDQSETQVLADHLYHRMMAICGVPSSKTVSGSTSDNSGAVLARDGWYQADNFARNTTDLYKESNRYFDEMIVEILRRKVNFSIGADEFEIQLAHNEISNLLIKTQGALNLKQLGLSPEIVLTRSGISNDPIADVAASRKYIDIAYASNELQSTENAPLDSKNWVNGYYRSNEGN